MGKRKSMEAHTADSSSDGLGSLTLQIGGLK